MPPVQRAYDVAISNGNTTIGLMLVKDKDGRKAWRRELAPGLAPVVRSDGDVDYRSLRPDQEIGADFTDLSGGFGAYDHEPGRYQYADGLDCSYPGTIVGGPYVASTALAPPGALDGAMGASCVHDNGTLFMGAGRRVYSWNGSNWIDKDNAGATVHDIVSYRGTLVAALGHLTAYRYSTDDGATWTTSILAQPYAKYFAVLPLVTGTGVPLLYTVRLNNAGTALELYSCSDPTNAGAWTLVATLGDGADDATSLRRAGVGKGLLIGTESALLLRDLAGNVSPVAGSYRKSTGAGLANFRSPVELDGRVYYVVGDFGLLEYDLETGRYRTGLAPLDYGPSVSIVQAGIVGLASDGEWLYAGLGGATGFVFKARYIGGRWVWHGAILRAAVSISFMTVALDGGNRYLRMGRGASNFTPVRALLPRGNPLQDAAARFGLSGDVYLGRYTAGLREVDKVARRLSLQTEKLDAGAGREIAVLWAADEAAEHAAVIVNTSPEADLDFKFTADPAAADLTVYRRLVLHIGLLNSTGAVPATTPAVLRGVVLRSLVRTTRRWRFEFTARLGDMQALVGGTLDPAATWSSVLGQLETAVRQSQPVRLLDRQQRTWWVVIDSFQESEVVDHGPGGAGRFASAVSIVALWVPEPVDAPE